MIANKILNCSRALVVLLAVTMGFTIAVHQRATRVLEHKPVPVINLDEINTKLDRILEEGRARDSVLLQQLLKLQQQPQNNQGRIAEVSQN